VLFFCQSFMMKILSKKFKVKSEKSKFVFHKEY
jgi:hypothetical protein